jgi:hypothetical protein
MTEIAVGPAVGWKSTDLAADTGAWIHELSPTQLADTDAGLAARVLPPEQVAGLVDARKVFPGDPRRSIAPPCG